jgi:hypothetical protein
MHVRSNRQIADTKTKHTDACESTRTVFLQAGLKSRMAGGVAARRGGNVAYGTEHACRQSRDGLDRQVNVRSVGLERVGVKVDME